jgi:hypothetical protein
MLQQAFVRTADPRGNIVEGRPGRCRNPRVLPFLDPSVAIMNAVAHPAKGQRGEATSESGFWGLLAVDDACLMNHRGKTANHLAVRKV